MAPRKSCENTKGIAAEVQDTHTLPETEKIISHDPLLASAADTQQLGCSGDLIPKAANIGYKQELKRHYSSIQVFAIAFSIMGLLPSISATLWFSVPAGPVGMVWGWFSASALIFLVALSIAELGSSLPTSGGLYWWTHYFAPERFKNPLSFLVGYSNTLGLIGGICSIDYGFASFIVSLENISSDGEWSPHRGYLYAIFVATVLCHGLLATFCARIMHHLQTWFVVANIALIVATVIALPVGMRIRGVPINSAGTVFGHIANEGTTWPTGWAFMLSWLCPIWTIGAFDSCVHMSEEAKSPKRAVPVGTVASVGCCWIIGFFLNAILAACAGSDFEAILASPFEQPMAQIYYNALGKHGALGFMSAISIVQFFMGLSIVIAASRQTWAFSRDGALPFSSYLRKISKSFGYQPLRTVWACCLTAIVLGLLSLINTAAANAIFSLAAASNNAAWGIPILCRVLWGQSKFRPGPFYLGRFSIAVSILALIYLAFATILCMFPTQGPNPDPTVMNYSPVVNGTVWGGALLYYFVYAQTWFKGPVHNTHISMEEEENI